MTSVVLGDMDGDGDLDVVAGNGAQYGRAYLGDGAGGFAPAWHSLNSDANNNKSVNLEMWTEMGTST